LFPWSLLWLNGVYWLARMGAGIWAGTTGQGEAARFPGMGGKLRIATALLKGNLSAIPLLPRMFSRRRAFRKFHKLTPRQIRRLLLDHRISLRELSNQSA
jgi:hypothetical protein